MFRKARRHAFWLRVWPQGLHMIKVDGLSKRFGEVIALQDISLELLPGTVTAIHGPSGSGKTTLLRLIAGLEAPTTGAIYIGGALVSTPAALTAPIIVAWALSFRRPPSGHI